MKLPQRKVHYGRLRSSTCTRTWFTNDIDYITNFPLHVFIWRCSFSFCMSSHIHFDTLWADILCSHILRLRSSLLPEDVTSFQIGACSLWRNPVLTKGASLYLSPLTHFLSKNRGIFLCLLWGWQVRRCFVIAVPRESSLTLVSALRCRMDIALDGCETNYQITHFWIQACFHDTTRSNHREDPLYLLILLACIAATLCN
jgi:hypothetical protein